MKFIGKLLIYLLVALLIVVLAFYFLLQTRWGASQASSWVTENTAYELNFDQMDHRFSSPSHIVLKKRHLRARWQTRHAGRQNGRYWSEQPSNHRSAAYGPPLPCFDGTLNLSPQTAPLPFQADRLQLNNMAFNSPNTEWDLSAQKVTGGVSPWQPEAGNVLGKKCADPDERGFAHLKRRPGDQRAD
ncbi:protein YicH [Enterobacter cancerogenus]|uniref:Protein YicH n=1 Tax=Enterobacter cancerogenus TaxID=69218 RepID=A0A484YZL6_9ENTR|nr:protein YicH [Enterobacter cancerogenus]